MCVCVRERERRERVNALGLHNLLFMPVVYFARNRRSNFLCLQRTNNYF